MIELALVFGLANKNNETCKFLLVLAGDLIDIHTTSLQHFEGISYLYIAALFGNNEMVQYLLKLGVDPNHSKFSALSQARRFHNEEIKQILKDAGAKDGKALVDFRIVNY